MFLNCNNINSSSVNDNESLTQLFDSLDIPEEAKRDPRATLRIKEDSLLLLDYTNNDSVHVFMLYIHNFDSSNIRRLEYYYPEGQLLSRKNFDDAGRANGFFEEYYKNGCAKTTGYYNNGLKEGKWLFYYDNCNKERSLVYNKGKINGLDSIWYKNGILKEVFDYQNAMLIDTGYVFNNNGHLKTMYFFKNGQLSDSLNITH